MSSGMLPCTCGPQSPPLNVERAMIINLMHAAPLQALRLWRILRRSLLWKVSSCGHREPEASFQVTNCLECTFARRHGEWKLINCAVYPSRFTASSYVGQGSLAAPAAARVFIPIGVLCAQECEQISAAMTAARN